MIINNAQNGEIFSFAFLLMVLAVGVTATSCGSDDDDDNKKSETTTSGIVGTWKQTFSSGYIILTFNSNGTGSYVEFDSADGNHSQTFSWTMRGNNVALVDDDGNIETYTVVSLTSTNLIWKYEDDDNELESWTRQ